MLQSGIVREYNPFFQNCQSKAAASYDRTPPDNRLIRQTRPGDSCYYQGKRYQIKRIGAKITTLIDVSEYIRNGLRGRHGLPIPKGFNVSTSEVYHIRFNYWNV
jgi:hypothetical protein